MHFSPSVADRAYRTHLEDVRFPLPFELSPMCVQLVGVPFEMILCFAVADAGAVGSAFEPEAVLLW